MPENSPRTSYDEIPYPSFPFVESHPDRLATVATLFGMSPPPVSNCRVLELACAHGDNLIPMALGLPEAEFVGIDLSETQVAHGNGVIEQLGLKNIKIEQRNICEIPDDDNFGQFDYIIAHGVYSWVPPEVQNAILSVCDRHLSPNGVAFISYNVYPGWHMRGMLRDMMLFHTMGIEEPRERVKQAEQILSFLCQSIPDRLDDYRGIFRGEQKTLDLAKGGIAYLFHEFLEENNQPVYFFQFAQQAAQHNMQYLGESDISEMQTNMLPDHVPAALNKLGDDLIRREQYLDFLKCRQFRETLLCHADVKLERQPQPERLMGMYVSANIKCTEKNPDLMSNEVLEFRDARGVKAGTGHSISKSALMHLSNIWPQLVSFDELQKIARANLAEGKVVLQATADFEHDTRVLADNLWGSHAGGVVELSVSPAQFSLEISERPLASPLARLQAKNTQTVTNLRHAIVELNDLNCQLLQKLDGRHTRSELLDYLVQLVAEEGMLVQRHGKTITDPEQVRDHLRDGLEENLKILAKAALFIS